MILLEFPCELDRAQASIFKVDIHLPSGNSALHPAQKGRKSVVNGLSGRSNWLDNFREFSDRTSEDYQVKRSTSATS
jgi:hypothetical protein